LIGDAAAGAAFGADALGAAAGFAVTFAAAVFAAVTLAAASFADVCWAEVLAVFSGIALLLFLVDLAADAFAAARVSLTGVRARPLDALRLAAAAFLVLFEALFLRVFCDTAFARNCHAPV
jgi:hypothetical protein